MKKIFLVVCICCSLFGCANAVFTSTKSVSYQPTKEVEVLYEAPTKPHEVFGLIDGLGSANVAIADVLNEMVKKAKEVGADVLYIKETARSGNFSKPYVVGYTIKYKK